MADTSQHFTLYITGGTGTKDVLIFPSGSKNTNNYDYKAQGEVTDGEETLTFKAYHFGKPTITPVGGTAFPASGGTLAFNVYSHYPWWFNSKPWWLSIKDANNTTINEGSVQSALPLDNPYKTIYMTAIANTTTNSKTSTNFRMIHSLRNVTQSATTAVTYLELTQAGAEINGTITTPSSTSIPCTGGTVYLDITVPQGVPWHLGNVNSNYGMRFYDPNGNEFNYWQDSQTGTGVSQRYSVVWTTYSTGTETHTWTPSLLMVDSSSGTGYRGVEATFTFAQEPCAPPSSIMTISGLTNGDTYQINFSQSAKTFTIPYSVTNITTAHTITITYPDGDRSDISYTGFPSSVVVSNSGNTKTRINNLGTGDVSSSFDLTVNANDGGVRFINVELADTFGDYLETHKAGTIHLRQDAYFPGSISGTTYGSTRYLSIGSGETTLSVPYSAYVQNCQVMVEYGNDTGVEVYSDQIVGKNVDSANGVTYAYFSAGYPPVETLFTMLVPENYKSSLDFIYMYLYQGSYTAQTSDLIGKVRLQRDSSSGNSSPLLVNYVNNGNWTGTSINFTGYQARFNFVVNSENNWFINYVGTGNTGNTTWYINDEVVPATKYPFSSSKAMAPGHYYINYLDAGQQTGSQTQLRLVSYKNAQQGWTVDAIISYERLS